MGHEADQLTDPFLLEFISWADGLIGAGSAKSLPANLMVGCGRRKIDDQINLIALQ